MPKADDDVVYYLPPIPKQRIMAKKVLAALQAAGIKDCYMVKGAFRPTIVINERRGKSDFTQYSISID